MSFQMGDIVVRTPEDSFYRGVTAEIIGCMNELYCFPVKILEGRFAGHQDWWHVENMSSREPDWII